MSTISGVSSSGDPFAQVRSQMQAKMFKKADSNGDGSVDKSEFTSMVNDVSKKTGKSFSSSGIDQAFAKLDSGGDSKISTEEMSKGMQGMMPPPPSTMDFARSMGSQSAGSGSTVNVSSSQGSRGGRGNPLDGLFAKADADSSGSLDSSELKTLAAKIKSDTGEDVSAKLDKLASDNGGTVTKDQLKAAVEADQASGAGRPPPPPPPGGAGGPGGGSGGVSGTQSSSSSNTSYDKLDTNQDGTVSEVERLMGELKNAASNSSGSSNSSNDSSSSQSASKKSSGFDAGQLIQQMYMQFSNGYSGQQSTFSAVA